MKVMIARTAEYTPEWEGNAEDPEPITVKLRYLTPEERDQCLHYAMGKSGDDETRVTIDPDRRKLFRLGVVEFVNLNVNGKAIKSAEQVLTTPGLDGLFTEVALHILAMNARTDEKNS